MRSIADFDRNMTLTDSFPLKKKSYNVVLSGYKVIDKTNLCDGTKQKWKV